MATQVQLRRGTSTECDAFTGVVGEAFYDTTNKRLRISDGSTPGGTALAKTSELPGSNPQFTTIELGNASDTTISRSAAGVVTVEDQQLIKQNGGQNLTGGFTATSYNAGTKSSGTFTPDPANGNLQYATNGGAHTLAQPSSDCTMIVQYTNNASAGTITTSGFTKVSGTAPGTVNGDDFLAFIVKINGFSHLTWQALQ